MKSLSTVLVMLLLANCSKKNIYDPDKYFTKEQQDVLIEQSARYSAKLPSEATHQTKFKPAFDSYYKTVAKDYDWRACVPDQVGYYYFLITRKARSIWPAREAIGGRLIANSKGQLLDYEEVFRTWKMTEDSLNSRAFELFDLMVHGKDLTPYQSKYRGDRYIEFPDDRFSFDKKEKRWHDKELDSLLIK